MATINAIGSNKPIEVAFGGTGVATITGLLAGNGTTALNGRTITGTTNQITVTNGSGATANPTLALAATTVNSTQPAFLATLNADKTSVTGDGTAYTILFSTVVFDQASNYTAGSGTFMAPVTGNYQFSLNVTFLGLTVAMTSALIQIVTTARTYEATYAPFIDAFSGIDTAPPINILANMTANDTATFVVTVSGGTKAAGVRQQGGAGRPESFVSCFLAC
jgi:hypothetical protein